MPDLFSLNSHEPQPSSISTLPLHRLQGCAAWDTSPVLSLVVFPTIDWLRPTSEQGTWQLVVHIFLGFFGRLAIGGQNKLQQVNTCAVQSLHSGIFYPKCVFPAVVWSFYV